MEVWFALIFVGLGALGALWVAPRLAPQTAKAMRQWLGFGLIGVVLVGVVYGMLSGPAIGGVYNDIIADKPAAMPTQLALATLETLPNTGGGAAAPLPVTQRLIIRNGSATLVVTDTRAVRAAIEALVSEFANEGAFVVSTSERSSGHETPIINMQLRVPVAQFDAVMARLATLAVRVENRAETADDVTAEYVDLEARVTSLEAARDRLREIMENATTTEDLLQAEQQLTQREAEIEGLKGRMQYLAQSAQLSSISLELWPDVVAQPIDNSWRPAETARRAFDSLVESAKDFADWVIVFSITCMPWLLVFGLLAWGGWGLFKRWRTRQNKLPKT